MENCRFPNKLKTFRRLFHLSQKEVAALLGLKDASALSRWEKGISLPGLVHLFRLSRLYRTLPSEIYIELWQKISKELNVKVDDLLARKESFIINEVYHL